MAEVTEHPFWAGLRDGTLPGEALVRFVEQDTGHLLPCFGRAFARCAAVTEDDGHARLLLRCAAETVASAPRLRETLADMAPRLGVRPPASPVPAHPATRGQCAAVTAAAATSWAAGIGALLPFMVFHLEVCRDLAAGQPPASRYRPWTDAYQPGEGTWSAVRAVLAMVDEFGAGATAAQRAELADWFCHAARHEWAFAEAALSL
uniref:Putative transcriptional regulator n=1 Tax=Streptomyces tendae TaxID=1932 RepID=A7DWK2_STRTE|nr:putative transcriptional regulator [Streptomyces tendae]